MSNWTLIDPVLTLLILEFGLGVDYYSRTGLTISFVLTLLILEFGLGEIEGVLFAKVVSQS